MKWWVIAGMLWIFVFGWVMALMRVAAESDRRRREVWERHERLRKGGWL